MEPDIANYPGKWTDAQRIAALQNNPYKARRIFIELGGQMRRVRTDFYREIDKMTNYAFGSNPRRG